MQTERRSRQLRRRSRICSLGIGRERDLEPFEHTKSAATYQSRLREEKTYEFAGSTRFGCARS